MDRLSMSGSAIAPILLLLCLFDATHAVPTFRGSAISARGAEDPTPSIFVDQIRNPSEVFSVLLIIGADVIQKAVAQLGGTRLFGYHVNCVPFSFGWVAYSFNSLLAAFGEGTFMPDPDSPASVITVSSGIKKANESWIIGRLIRDLEGSVTQDFKEWKEYNNHGELGDSGEGESGLLVTCFEAQEQAGRPHGDIWWASFFPVVVVQLVVASVPIIIHRNWSILLATAVGTVLALITGSLREWRKEKFACRQNSPHDYIITRGNGHPHVFVILRGQGKDTMFKVRQLDGTLLDTKETMYPGLYLDDLSSARRHGGLKTRVLSSVLAVLWFGFLITVGGIESDTWYLLAVGSIGMVQNVCVAAAPRSTAAHGIPLERCRLLKTFGVKSNPNGDKPPVPERLGMRPRAINVIQEVEESHPGVGLALLPEFFPGGLRDNEIAWRDHAKATVKDRRKAREKGTT